MIRIYGGQHDFQKADLPAHHTWSAKGGDRMKGGNPPLTFMLSRWSTFQMLGREASLWAIWGEKRDKPS